LTLGGSAVVQPSPQTKVTRKKGNRCAFVAKSQGTARLKLDLGRGAWNAKIVRRDLGQLTNPFGTSIGDDSGGESLGFETTKSAWKYLRTERLGRRSREAWRLTAG